MLLATLCFFIITITVSVMAYMAGRAAGCHDSDWAWVLSFYPSEPAREVAGHRYRGINDRELTRLYEKVNAYDKLMSNLTPEPVPLSEHHPLSRPYPVDLTTPPQPIGAK